MNLCLSLATSQPRIEYASPEFLKEFGLELAVAQGRTINLILGPNTNSKVLNSVIETVQHGKQAQAQLVLYSRACAGALFNLRAQPSSTGERMVLTLSRCDAAPFAEAAHEDGVVKVLLEAKKPFKVAHVSLAFAEAYCFSPEQITNRTLSMIHGPCTDLQTWNEMLVGALSGAAQAGCIQTYTRYGTEAEGLTHVRVTPVMGAGGVGHLVVVFSSARHSPIRGWGPSSPPQVKPSGPERSDLVSALDGSVRKVIEELRATPPQDCKRNARHHAAHISQRTSAAAAPSSLAKSGSVQPGQEAAALGQSSASSNSAVLTIKRLREYHAANHLKRKIVSRGTRQPTTCTVKLCEPTSFFSLLIAVIMTILSVLSLGLVSTPITRPRKPVGHSAYARKRDWEMLHFIGMSSDDLECFTVY